MVFGPLSLSDRVGCLEMNPIVWNAFLMRVGKVDALREHLSRNWGIAGQPSLRSFAVLGGSEGEGFSSLRRVLNIQIESGQLFLMKVVAFRRVHWNFAPAGKVREYVLVRGMGDGRSKCRDNKSPRGREFSVREIFILEVEIKKEPK